jgi:hypothetical protein
MRPHTSCQLDEPLRQQLRNIERVLEKPGRAYVCSATPLYYCITDASAAITTVCCDASSTSTSNSRHTSLEGYVQCLEHPRQSLHSAVWFSPRIFFSWQIIMSIQVTHFGPMGQTSEIQPGWTVTRGLHRHLARVSTSTDAVLRLDLSSRKTYSSGQRHTLSICLVCFVSLLPVSMSYTATLRQG